MTRRTRKPPARSPTREIEASASHIGARGDAVLAGPIYAPGLLPGERARLVVQGERGRVIERLSESQERAQPVCPVAERCGGCSLQHWAGEPYRAWKRGRVVEALAQAGLKAEVGDLIDAHGAGRRRVTLHAERRGGAVLLGYAERAGPRLVDIADCPAASAGIRAAMADLRALAAVLAPDRARLALAATETETGLDVAITGARALGLAEREAAAEIAARADWARLSIEGETLAERRRPLVRFGAAEITPPPGAFLQATAAGEAALAEKVLAGAKGAKRVADLYAGCGTFALRLAAYAPVTAVEGDGAALAVLRAGADRTAGLKPLAAQRRDLAREPLSPAELSPFDAVVIDPPRAGAKAQCDALAASAVNRVISVSCNPATFARDAAILAAAGFQLGPVTPVDQFAWTAHVEMVAVFART